jgi:NAD(P)-dependent dehydrogenase (short-subunit alcohol dehydrogenase family)
MGDQITSAKPLMSGPRAAEWQRAAALSAVRPRPVKQESLTDILVNAAGGAYHAADGHNGVLGQSAETWDLMHQMNLRYVVQEVWSAAPHMRDSGGGAIVNVSSVAAHSAPFESACGAAKAGLENWSRTVAFELGPFGIRTNVVASGPIYTDRLADLGIEAGAMDEMFQDRVPLQRVAHTDDIASVILFSASDLASMVNGATIPVEGGLQTFAPYAKVGIAQGWKKL